MARSPQYWYDKIVTEKQSMSTLNVYQPNVDSSQTLLSDLTTTSRVARWRIWIWAVATCIYALDVVFDLALVAFEILARNSRYGTIPWWEKQSLLFQYGDSLVFQNNQYEYPTVNTANQIVKRSAGQENGDIVNIKVAKLVGGVPTKLNSTEKTAFTAYAQKIKPAGVKINIISDDPDELRLFVKVNYDALLLDSAGQLLATPGTYPVRDAINNYLGSLNDGFNGTLELCNLVDKIQAALGVKSVYIIQASARYGANPFLAFTERYQANAGHMVIDPVNPLSSTITYSPIN